MHGHFNRCTYPLFIPVTILHIHPPCPHVRYHPPVHNHLPLIHFFSPPSFLSLHHTTYPLFSNALQTHFLHLCMHGYSSYLIPYLPCILSPSHTRPYIFSLKFHSYPLYPLPSMFFSFIFFIHFLLRSLSRLSSCMHGHLTSSFLSLANPHSFSIHHAFASSSIS